MPSSHSQSQSTRSMPSLLEPHVAFGPLARGEGSLTLVTWVQGASANWLVLRYLYALLGGGGGKAAEGAVEDEEGGVPGVVLVSFLRDAKFWADGCARLGMDLDALRKSGRFSFVDGLAGGGGLYATPQAPSAGDGVIAGSVGQVGAVKTQVDAAVARLSAAAGRRKMLIMDGLDALVAMTPPGSASETESLLMSLRESVYSTLITLAADEPLMQAAVHQQHQQQQQGAKMTTSLEREQAALVLGQAHAADQVVSLRRLDTGAAADVSGVLRVATRGGNGGGADEGEELLYHVSGDGSVRVFERGA